MMSAILGNRLSRPRAAKCRGWAAGLVALCGLVLSGVAMAQMGNTLEQVTVTRGSSGKTVVRFQLKSPPANPPAGFSVQSPPRIALDFLDTANAMGVTQREVSEPALRSLNFIQSGNRTRVVFNLNKPQVFETTVEGNAVLVGATGPGCPVDSSRTGAALCGGEGH